MTPHGRSSWVTDRDLALFTDLYELKMLRAYREEGMDEEAVFDLYFRGLPESRNYLLACGLDDALHYLETVRFGPDDLEYLATTGQFDHTFLSWLESFRFSGDVWAVPEGTPVFADEPLLEVVAPIGQAQLAETFLMNQVHFQTAVASKAARVVHAARGIPVVDFGLRRYHGTDAGMKAARAFHVAGVASTSNVLAGAVYGMPIAGTMAHSYVQAFDEEIDSFRAFARLYPETILLVDTYDTIEGVEKVVELARELGGDFRVSGVRIDSGDLIELTFRAREILDRAGLDRVGIFLSGGLDEHKVARIVGAGTPVVGFGVGTRMGVAPDAPALDIAYKLVEYGGEGRLKLSPGKPILPGRKQVFRLEEKGGAVRDLLARHDEEHDGEPLLIRVMKGGERSEAGREALDQARVRAKREIGRLPERVRAIEPADPAYTIEISQALRASQRAVARQVAD
ncbi:MAG: nicotinate phosphoribosyltransferase [Gemmatimonadota bacterium]